MAKELIITAKRLTPNLNSFIEMIIKEGPTPDEYGLMCVIAMMDEVFQEVLNDTSDNTYELRKSVGAMYGAIESYLDDNMQTN